MMHHRLCMLTMLLAGTAGAETFCGTGPATVSYTHLTLPTILLV